MLQTETKQDYLLIIAEQNYSDYIVMLMDGFNTIERSQVLNYNEAINCLNTHINNYNLSNDTKIINNIHDSQGALIETDKSTVYKYLN